MDEDRRRRQESRARDVAAKLVDDRATRARRAGQPAGAGDVFMVDGSAGAGTLWLVLGDASRAANHVLAAPLDDLPLVGSEDFLLPTSSPLGALAVRAGLGRLVRRDCFGSDARVSVLPAEAMEVVQHRRARLLGPEFVPSGRQRETDGDPDYRAHREALEVAASHLTRARAVQLLLGLKDFVARSLAELVPDASFRDLVPEHTAAGGLVSQVSDALDETDPEPVRVLPLDLDGLERVLLVEDASGLLLFMTTPPGAAPPDVRFEGPEGSWSTLSWRHPVAGTPWSLSCLIPWRDGRIRLRFPGTEPVVAEVCRDEILGTP